MSFNYEAPRPLERATEHAGMFINRGWGWKWKGRQRWDGREREYYTRTSFGTKGELRDAMGTLFPGVEFIDGTPAEREPAIVHGVMPPESFQHGILKELIRLNGGAKVRDESRTLLDKFRENLAAFRKLESLIVAAKPLPKSLIA